MSLQPVHCITWPFEEYGLDGSVVVDDCPCLSTLCSVLPGGLQNMRLDGRVVVDDCPCLSSLYVVHCITWPFDEYEA